MIFSVFEFASEPLTTAAVAAAVPAAATAHDIGLVFLPEASAVSTHVRGPTFEPTTGIAVKGNAVGMRQLRLDDFGAGKDVTSGAGILYHQEGLQVGRWCFVMIT